jgi:hypothetical protein
MRTLRKLPRLTTRYTSEQLARLARAAKIVSAERGETVDESTLSRELTMRGVEEILARATVAA